MPPSWRRKSLLRLLRWAIKTRALLWFRVPREKTPIGKELALWLAGVGVNFLQLLFSPMDRRHLVGILAISALLLVHPVLHLPWAEASPNLSVKRIRGAIAILAMLSVFTIYGAWSWPPIRRHELNAKERDQFEKPLKDFKNPQTRIHLYCAPEDEVDCEYATTLIPLFGEAGWDVSTFVDRVTLGRPQSGIVLGLHGTVKPEDEPTLKWNQGEWTRDRPEQWAIRQAFVNIGIEPSVTSGGAIPENQINVYVGHERADESAPTNMTQQFEQLERMRSEHPEIVRKLLNSK
jgi:hypothetical protein